MMLRERMLPCQSREAVVTVRSYQNGILDGYLQHPRLEKKEKLKSVSQLVLLLDGFQGPVFFRRRRRFRAFQIALQRRKRHARLRSDPF